MTGARAYARTQNETASSERLMVLLFEAALRDIRIGARAWRATGRSEASASLGRASDIVAELLATLDHSQAPELCQKLSDVYQFVLDRLLRAHDRPASPLRPGGRAGLRAHRARLRRGGAEAWRAAQPKPPPMSAAPTTGLLAGLAQAAEALEQSQLATRRRAPGDLAQLCAPAGYAPRLVGAGARAGKGAVCPLPGGGGAGQAELVASLSQSATSAQGLRCLPANKR